MIREEIYAEVKDVYLSEAMYKKEVISLLKDYIYEVLRAISTEMERMNLKWYVGKIPVRFDAGSPKIKRWGDEELQEG